MKNILRLILFIFLCAGSFFCKSQKTAKSTVTTGSHNSQNSLDWDGIYRGVLPCADCEGIQKTIYLNKDGTYKVKVKYLGKQDTPTEYSGKFGWSSQGNTITLNELNGQQIMYFVGENTLTQLD